MKREVIKNLLFTFGMFLLIFCFLPAKVKATPEEDFNYEEKDGEITITGFKGAKDGGLTIPEKINGYPVTEIGSNAFSHSGIKGNLVIPDSVTAIGESAFDYCIYLTGDLIIPDSVKTIGESAFSDCIGFTGQLQIGNNVTKIGRAAFSRCGQFTGSLIIPDSVTEIGNYAFYHCAKLQYISVPFSYDEIAGKNIFDGCTQDVKYKGEFVASFDKNNESASGDMKNRVTHDTILYLPECEYEAPEDEIFLGWSYVPDGERITDTQITLTEDITLYALWTSATAPREVCTIVFNKGGDDVTGDCPENISANQGEKVTLPKNTLAKQGFYFVGWMVGNSKFANTFKEESEYTVPWSETITLTAKWTPCYSYSVNNNSVTIKGIASGISIKSNLIIPKEIDGYPVTEIAPQAFSECKTNGNLVIPDSVTIIGDNAFYNCKNLTGNLTIPDSVKEIGASAFYECPGFDGKLKLGNNVTKIGASAFCKCSNLNGTLTIPDSVTEIGDYAFYKCSNLNGTLTIPDSVTEIGDYAFYNCTNFTEDLIIPDSVTTIANYAFANCSGLSTISVPFLNQANMEAETGWGKNIFLGCTATFIYYEEYEVSFDKNNDAASGSMDKVKTKDHLLTLPECGFTTPKGYKFAGWSSTASGEKITSEKITIDGESKDVTIYALWEKLPVYKITFVGGSGATGKAPSALSGNEKDKVTLPKNTFTKKGYKFVGWTDGSKTYKAGASYTIPAKNVKLTAKWQKTEPTKRELIEQFAERMYTKALGRSAEPDGLKYWADRLEKQIDDGANMAYGFITSEEFKARKLSDDQFIETMYQTFFGRTADSTGKTYWMNQIKSGASRETVLAGFVKSEEFGKLCSDAGIERGLILEDGTPVNAGIYQFVKRQYTCCLQRDGERDGMDYWATKIAKREVSAVDAAKEFFFSAEFESKGLSDKQFVERLYETFLGRPFDEIGYAYWNDKMSKGETRREVIDEFAASEEFKGILTSFGL